MLLLVLISFSPLFTLQTEVFLNYNGFIPNDTMPSTSATYLSPSSALSQATSRLSAAARTTYAQQQVQWLPTAVQNDWDILQAAANTAVDVAATSQTDVTPTDRQQLRHEAMALDKQLRNAPHNSYDTPHTAQKQQQQQNPVNYYIYNSSNSGNYRSPAPDMRYVAPNVLATRNQQHILSPSGERSRRREHRNSTADSVLNHFNNRGSVNTYNNNYHNKSANQHDTHESNDQTATNKVNNAAAIIVQSLHPAVFGWQDIKSRITGEGNANRNGDRNDAGLGSMWIDSVENDINSLEEAQFDEVLVPLGNALDKVRHFCEVFRQIISDDEADSASDDLVTLGSSAEALAAPSAAVGTAIPVDDNPQRTLKVQGQRSPPTATAATIAHLITQQSQPLTATALVWPTMMVPATPRSTAVTASARAITTTTNTSANTPSSAKSLTSTALAIGRGKKLKKKLKKLMLPLLLAYKLKFIALVPLLIGGLTLLVGSTGLAGFFFALFLTVMSLKSGGSVNKSIVIKKVW